MAWRKHFKKYAKILKLLFSQPNVYADIAKYHKCYLLNCTHVSRQFRWFKQFKQISWNPREFRIFMWNSNIFENLLGVCWYFWYFEQHWATCKAMKVIKIKPAENSEENKKTHSSLLHPTQPQFYCLFIKFSQIWLRNEHFTRFSLSLVFVCILCCEW